MATRSKRSRAATATDNGERRGDRREQVMQCAAVLFAQNGYDGTSIRDIAAAVGMLPGSLYHHFASKEDLFRAIHAEVVGRIDAEVERSLAGLSDPWQRLEAAAAAHLRALLGPGNLVAIVSPDFPESTSDLRSELVAQRDTYERRFLELVEALTLPEGTDRGLLRLMLMGALNWAPVWYRARRGNPETIARAFVRFLRRSLDDSRGAG